MPTQHPPQQRGIRSAEHRWINTVSEDKDRGNWVYCVLIFAYRSEISLGIYLGITCVQPVSTPASERRVQAVYISLYLVDVSAMDPPPATHLFVSDGPQTQPLRSRGTSSNIPGCCPLTRALHGSTGMFMPSSSFLSDPRMGLPDHLPKPLQGRPSWDNVIVQIIHNVFTLSFPNLLLLKCPLSVNVMSQKRSFPSFFSINLLYTKYTKSPIFWSCFK